MSDPTTRRALIIHGFAATPRDHWFDWLARSLTDSGLPSTVIALPDSAAPDPDAWLAALADDVSASGPPTTVVAHSLGCLTLLRRLSDAPWPLDRAVLVAGFLDLLPALPQLDHFIDATAAGLRISTVRAHVRAVSVLRSDDDALVPTSHTDRLASLFGVSPTVVVGAGHFLADEGVTELPQAWRAAAGN